MTDFLKFIVYGGLFAVPFLTLYVANDYFFPYITGKNFDFRIIVELVFFAWIVLALADAKYRPKFSWLISAFGIFLIVMFFANLLGQHPHSSFWSNFERMDGYVTLVHVFLYVLVLGSVITTKKMWGYYLHTTLVVAFIVSLYGLAQFAGVVEGVERTRIESYLGNAAYLSIYMLFHIFFVFWLFVESKVNVHRIIYGILAVMFIFTLIETGTRGTVLGLAVGIAVMVSYIALFGAKYKEFRRVAIGAFVFLLVGAGVFILGKDSAFIQENQNLARIANINFEDDLKIRSTIWGMAWQGVQERPVLGWGQSNFNYIFNDKYDPSLYGQEQWFDRAHDIVMDWLVAGGFLGLIAYLSIFIACIYYLLIVPILRKEDETFTVLERAVLLGILAGYFTHNIVVFDNIISYIFFAVILALIHSRVGKVIPQIEKVKVDRSLINQFFAPVAGVLVVVLIYSINIPGMRAATDIIDAYRVNNPADRLVAFETALGRDSFAHQEITEQLAQQAMSMVQDPKIPEEVRQKYITRSEEELKKLVEEKPGDARVHVFFGSFYRAIGNLPEAEKQMQLAHELSPKKQSIISQQGIIAYSQGDNKKARDLFKEAFTLDENNLEAREYYAAMLFITGDAETAKALASDQIIIDRFALNDFLVNSANNSGDSEFLVKLYESRVNQKPDVEQNWVSLSFLYYQMGNKDKAIDALERSAKAKPSFAKTASCFAENIKANRDPQIGCQAEK
jgi:cytochrome c-type biogenesis protein CcmH/NrfG/O-antigen ligase